MTFYSGDGDFLFPSERLNGTQPLTPQMVLKKIIRPALVRARVKDKVIGWHSFRHSLATNLRSLGVDVKVAQELLRHATRASQWTSTLKQSLRLRDVRVEDKFSCYGEGGRGYSSLRILRDDIKQQSGVINL